jgi:hypothetical protein
MHLRHVVIGLRPLKVLLSARHCGTMQRYSKPSSPLSVGDVSARTQVVVATGELSRARRCEDRNE